MAPTTGAGGRASPLQLHSWSLSSLTGGVLDADGASESAFTSEKAGVS